MLIPLRCKRWPLVESEVVCSTHTHAHTLMYGRHGEDMGQIKIQIRAVDEELGWGC